MAGNTYLIVNGKKIKVSEIVSDLPRIHNLLGDTRDKGLCYILEKLCEKIVQSKVVLAEGNHVHITGTGTSGDPYRISADQADDVILEGGTLLGRYSPLDGVQQTISLGDNLVLDPLTGILNVVLPEVILPDGPDKNYTHNQQVASSLWTVTHNLNKFPSVTVVVSAGSECIGDVTYIDTNTLQISFSLPFSGKAFLN